ncbi:prephenate dehydratase [Nanobdella aerobiophila]|uniref:Prephenate dehydratase n=1 Tax=Nanobdella aerobiophila TaxID=2586965 RepID=A0A915SF98_9ARCH|nr:prephenate dehydratase [Nanobdella aerobiophila]
MLEYKPKISVGFDFPIELYLIGKNNIEAKYVYSHSQALEQAFNYINKKSLISIHVSSTSEAVKKVKEEYEKGLYYSYAIGNKRSARLFNLDIIEKLDIDNNFTRFILIGDHDIEEDNNKTLLIFKVDNKPGSLYKFLEYFYDNKINLSKIESIPIRNGTWEYLFILEYEGDKSLIDKEKINGEIFYIEDYKYLGIKKYME